MSKVEIEIPDNRWLRGEWQIRPKDRQLCVVIPNIGNKNLLICQWRWEPIIISVWTPFVIYQSDFIMRDLESSRNILDRNILEWVMLIVGNLSDFRQM